MSRPTRCTNSYNESLSIIKRSTCFHHQERRFGAVYCNWYKPVRLAYTNCDTASKNIAPDNGLKSPKHVERLMINKDSLYEFVPLRT